MAGSKGKGLRKLSSASPNAVSMRRGPTTKTEGPEFEVVRIVSQITENNREVLPRRTIWFYEIEWKGYSGTTWEPRVNLSGCDIALRAWYRKNRQENEKKQKKRSSSSPKGQKAPKKLKMDDHTQNRDSIEELTSGAVTAGTPVEIEARQTSSRYDFPPINATPDHPETALFQAKLDQLSGPPITLVNTTGDGERSPPLGFELLGSLRLANGIPDFDIGFNCGCECPSSGCIDPKVCACAEDAKPQHFAYKNDRVKTGRSNEFCIVECNRACACGNECGNRVVQRGRQIPLEIFRTSYKGWVKGLRCPKTLEAGTFVELYLGEVIGADEATLRAELGDAKGSSYLFDLDKFSELPEYENLEIFTIDGENCGSVARFINHSCEPNLQTFAVLTDRTDRRVYNLALFTIRKIKAFEELTFSYSDDVDEEVATDGLPKPRVEAKWACKCGARSCRGYIWNH